MVIKTVLEQLANQDTNDPSIKILKKGEGYKVIVLGFKKGMILKEHSTPIPAKLIVVDGKVNYKEVNRTLILDKFDELDIPVNVIHAVEAIEDSICFLIQGE
jgi:quercetin dioxygenase-like cupin family protein